MASLPHIAYSAAIPAETGSRVRAAASRAESTDRTSSAFSYILGGIALAGGLYPIVLALMLLLTVVGVEITAILSGSVGELREPHFWEAVFLVLEVLLICACMGTLWAGLVALCTLPVAFLFVRTLGVRVNVIRFGAVCGGTVGLLAVMPPLVCGDPMVDWPVLIAWFVLGAVVATPLGQLGGAWGGSRVATQYWPEEGDRSAAAKQRWFQFGLKQLLWVSTWLGLMLAAIHLAGLPIEIILPLLAVWLVYQAATLWLGWLVICRLWPRWRAYRLRRFT
jgi:hypothetical protein